MKIIKYFEDFEFYCKYFDKPHNVLINKWEWGLSQDCNLYCRCSEMPNWGWFSYNEIEGYKVNLWDMKKIVDNFSYLLIVL